MCLLGIENMHLPTKFDRNRIHSWYMEIMLFSKWRPSAILNLRKFQFLSCDLYWHVILHLPSKFLADRSIWRRDIAKNDFQYGIRPPSCVCCDVIILHQKTAFYVLNFVLNFDDVRLRKFWNILYFMFQRFGLKLPISGLICLRFFTENRQKCEN